MIIISWVSRCDESALPDLFLWARDILLLAVIWHIPAIFKSAQVSRGNNNKSSRRHITFESHLQFPHFCTALQWDSDFFQSPIFATHLIHYISSALYLLRAVRYVNILWITAGMIAIEIRHDTGMSVQPHGPHAEVDVQYIFLIILIVRYL